MKDRTYIAIDLKSFYASVECRERDLDPLDTNLVVADESRTDKTICLAVTPSLKSYGISGRGRLFEVKQRVKEANAGRQHDAPGRRLDGTSHFFSELQANPSLAIDFIIAPPRMAYYMEYSTRIYQVFLIAQGKLVNQSGKVVELIKVLVLAKHLLNTVDRAFVVGDKPLFVGLTELILLADPDALKDLLHLFFGCRELHPLTDQHTLVVLAKVRDEGFKITV